MLLGNVHLENEWMGEKNEWNIAQAKKDHLEKVIRSFKALPVLADSEIHYFIIFTESYTTLTKALLKNTLRKKVKFCICGVDGHWILML